MKIVNIIVLLLIAAIKYIESCMRVTNCQWKDPCNKYTKYKDCYAHKGCTMGQPDDSGGQIYIEIGDDDEIMSDPNQNPPIPAPLFCVSKDVKQCYVKLSCAIF